MKKLPAVFAIVIALSTTVMCRPVTAEATTQQQTVLISEIKLGESKSTTEMPTGRQFVSLYNPNASSIAMDGWRIEYAKPGFVATQCATAEWGGSFVVSQALGGKIIAANSVLSIELNLTDKVAGAVRIVAPGADASLVVNDLVGWGDTAPCFFDKPTVIPANGKSIHRYLTCELNQPVDTRNNFADFSLHQTPAAGTLSQIHLPECLEQPPASTQPTCEAKGIVISELLPNPAGSDDGTEFIELYNPNAQAVSLDGCGLQTTAKDEVYWFAKDTVMQPSTYVAFYNNLTKLILTNSTADTVYLLTDTKVELANATYTNNLEDAVAWAWFGNSEWEQTYTPSPNAANIRQPLLPCPTGQTRNQETGRCRIIVTLADVTSACKPGQERNPETNRCRSLTSASTTLTPCKPNQERNPQTNRCRAVASETALKECAEGQERNPETNRCRKVTSAVAGATNVKDIPAPTAVNSMYWWAAGIAVAGATGYGLYEWRHGIRRFIDKVRGKITP